MEQVVLVGTALVGSFMVMRYSRLPNWLTIGGALVGISVAVQQGTWQDGLASVGGVVAAMAMLLPLAMFGLAAPGDIKLAGAFGACVGWSQVAFLGVSVVGVALVSVLVQTLLSGSLRRLLAWCLTTFGLIRVGGPWRAHLLRPAAGRIPLSLVISLAALLFAGVRMVSG